MAVAVLLIFWHPLFLWTPLNPRDRIHERFSSDPFAYFKEHGYLLVFSEGEEEEEEKNNNAPMTGAPRFTHPPP